MSFIDPLNFCYKKIYELHVSVKPLYDLLDDNVEFHWNIELEALFQRYKICIKKMLL